MLSHIDSFVLFYSQRFRRNGFSKRPQSLQLQHSASRPYKTQIEHNEPDSVPHTLGPLTQHTHTAHSAIGWSPASVVAALVALVVRVAASAPSVAAAGVADSTDASRMRGPYSST